jgi:hypothetical protein
MPAHLHLTTDRVLSIWWLSPSAQDNSRLGTHKAINHEAGLMSQGHYDLGWIRDEATGW